MGLNRSKARSTLVRLATFAGLALFVVAPALAAAKDSDRDGLPNAWEKNKTTPGGLHLKALGANPKRKDIFVELDYASAAARNSLACSELNNLVTAFRKAPVSNPDGSKGITLHIDAGKTCAGHKYKFGGSNLMDVPGGCTSTGAGINALQLTKFAANRIHVFHHSGVFVSLCGGEPAGAADLHGTASIVSLASGGFAHVFMHEIGHNLGLDHPPGTDINHLSVMGQVPETKTCQSCAPHEVLDYQRFSTPALNENALSEEAGLGTAEAHDFFVFWVCAGGTTHANSPSPVRVNSWPAVNVDWNCTGDPFYPDLPGSQSGVQSGTVQADINGDGQLTTIPAEPPEWPHLDYRSGGKIGAQHSRAALAVPEIVR